MEQMPAKFKINDEVCLISDHEWIYKIIRGYFKDGTFKYDLLKLHNYTENNDRDCWDIENNLMLVREYNRNGANL